MGMDVWMTAQAFHMDEESKDSAMYALWDLPTRHFPFVDPHFAQHTTFEETVADWRWEAVVDGAGHVVRMNFDGRNNGANGVLFETIAPFVQSGSFIEMASQDGSRWRWRFEKGAFYTDTLDEVAKEIRCS